MKIERKWAIPSHNTFSQPPIKKLIQEEIIDGVIIDPFANDSKIAHITNDLDPQFDTDYHLDAIDFLKTFDNESVEMVLFDPPYSVRQVSEVYRRLGKTVNMETTQCTYWSNLKNEVVRILKPGGKVISFGWNSSGMGKSRGFKTSRILLVNHSGYHNDTICVVDVKVQSSLFSHGLATTVRN